MKNIEKVNILKEKIINFLKTKDNFWYLIISLLLFTLIIVKNNRLSSLEKHFNSRYFTFNKELDNVFEKTNLEINHAFDNIKNKNHSNDSIKIKLPTNIILEDIKIEVKNKHINIFIEKKTANSYFSNNQSIQLTEEQLTKKIEKKIIDSILIIKFL